MAHLGILPSLKVGRRSTDLWVRTPLWFGFRGLGFGVLGLVFWLDLQGRRK